MTTMLDTMLDKYTVRNRPTVVFDLDDTICDLATPLSEAIFFETGQWIFPRYWFNYDLTSVYNIKQSQICDIIKKYHITTIAKPEINAVDVLNYYLGCCKVIILTARKYMGEEEKDRIAYWLHCNNIIGMEKKNIMTVTVEEKVSILSSLGDVSFFVDDRFETCVDARKNCSNVRRVVLINKPWNINNVIMPGLIRINSLEKLNL